MKLNNNDLREILLTNMKESILKTRKKCPSPNQLLLLFRAKRAEKKKTKIIDHITNCYHCAHEFGFILRALRYERTLNHTAEKLIQTKTKMVSPSRFSWKTSYAIVGIFIVCVFITHFITSRTASNDNHRTPIHAQIALILPQEKSIPKSSLYFRWDNIEDSEYYTLELYDETLYQIWKSNKISDSNFELTEDTLSRMEVNKTYFWMVTAFFPNGRKIESQLKEIILTK
jgi:hypothetical protein